MESQLCWLEEMLWVLQLVQLKNLMRRLYSHTFVVTNKFLGKVKNAIALWYSKMVFFFNVAIAMFVVTFVCIRMPSLSTWPFFQPFCSPCNLLDVLLKHSLKAQCPKFLLIWSALEFLNWKLLDLCFMHVVFFVSSCSSPQQGMSFKID